MNELEAVPWQSITINRLKIKDTICTLAQTFIFKLPFPLNLMLKPHLFYDTKTRRKSSTVTLYLISMVELSTTNAKLMKWVIGMSERTRIKGRKWRKALARLQEVNDEKKSDKQLATKATSGQLCYTCVRDYMCKREHACKRVNVLPYVDISFSLALLKSQEYGPSKVRRWETQDIDIESICWM